MSDTREILTERGKRYGAFSKHALVTQRLKEVMQASPNFQNNSLSVGMLEALEMIFHKIGRILNGDPTYDDSWKDIAGYAQLVVDIINGKETEK